MRVFDLETCLFATPPEAAELFRVNQRTIRHGIEQGEIPATRLRGAWRIPTPWIRRQLQNDVRPELVP